MSASVAGPERRQPATQELGLRGRGLELARSRRPSHVLVGTQRYWPLLQRAARPPAHEPPLRGEQREQRGAGARLDLPSVRSRSAASSRGSGRPRQVRRERLAARLDARRAAARPRSSTQRARPRRDAAVATNPRAASARARRPPGCRPRRRPGRARVGRPRASAACEHPDECSAPRTARARGRRARSRRPRPDREEDRRGVGRVQRDDRRAPSSGSAARVAGGEPVADDEPRAPLVDVDPPHRARSTRHVGSRAWRSRSTSPGASRSSPAARAASGAPTR